MQIEPQWGRRDLRSQISFQDAVETAKRKPCSSTLFSDGYAMSRMSVDLLRLEWRPIEHTFIMQPDCEHGRFPSMTSRVKLIRREFGVSGISCQYQNKSDGADLVQGS